MEYIWSFVYWLTFVLTWYVNCLTYKARNKHALCAHTIRICNANADLQGLFIRLLKRIPTRASSLRVRG